jgi:hypothetical protein
VNENGSCPAVSKAEAQAMDDWASAEELALGERLPRDTSPPTTPSQAGAASPRISRAIRGNTGISSPASCSEQPSAGNTHCKTDANGAETQSRQCTGPWAGAALGAVVACPHHAREPGPVLADPCRREVVEPVFFGLGACYIACLLLMVATLLR